MTENKEDKKVKEEDLRPHFVKVIEYNKEPWLTDVIIGQRGSKSHAHLTLSGSKILYLRDAENKEVIKEDF